MLATINKYMIYLRNIHLDLISESEAAPFLTALDWVNFYKNCKLADE